MITLGSLFDGSGGFPLAGMLNGATPLWASEIEPYPIAVTRSRFPRMRHLGDVRRICGGHIPPVDIITFGSPCQDMSIAGKRAGMKHKNNGDGATTRSGLFYEAIRIIREMREKTNGKYPTFAVWENVPGAFSSNNGEDFRCVLEEFTKICGGGYSVPRPDRGKWNHAGEIVAEGFSIAWRLFDAQYWGVPQRRKRIYLVADFADERAGKILFERESVPWNPSSCRTARENIAEYAPGSIGRSNNAWRLNHRGVQGNEAKYTPDANARRAICFKSGQGTDARSIGASEFAAPTLASEAGGNAVPSVCYAHSVAKVDDDQQEPIIFKERAGCPGGGKGILCCNKAFTISTFQPDMLCHKVCEAEGEQNAAVCVGNGQLNQINLGAKTGALNCMHDQQTVLYPAQPPRKYIIRRLMPLECCRLQGFPDGWGVPDVKGCMTDEEADFWEEVRKAHAQTYGKNYRPCANRTALVKWYNGLHTDGAEYKMWGNGIALPNAFYVVGGCVEALIAGAARTPTMK